MSLCGSVSGLLLALLCGCVTYPDLANRQGRSDHPVGEIQGEQTVGQTFISHHSGLNRIDLLLATYARVNTHPVTFHLKSSPESPADLVTITIDAQAVKDNSFYPFQFAPLRDSANRSYYFYLDSPKSEPDDAITIWASSLDPYAEGTLYLNHQASEGDLAFITHYHYQWDALLADIWRGLKGHLLPLIAAPILFLLPGYFLLFLLRLEREYDSMHLFLLSTGLSLAMIPLLLLFSSLTGVRLGGTRIAVIFLMLGLVAVWRLAVKFRGANLKAGLRVEGAYLLLLLVFLVSITVRLLFNRLLVVPAWTDGYHHTLISQLIVEQGTVPTSYRPYAPIDSFTYHFGFHSLVAFFHWLTTLEMTDSVLVVGQIINGLSVFTIYLLAERLTRDRLAGLLSALMVGVIFQTPAYFAQVSRYTQLTGMVILPLALVFTLELLEREKRDYRYMVAASVVLAALPLVHTRTLITFYATFLGPYLFYLTYMKRGEGKRVLEPWVRVALVSLLAMAIVSPWLWNLFRHFLANFLSFFSQSTPLINRVTLDSFFSLWDPALIFLAALGLGWGLYKKEKGLVLVALWTGCILLLILYTSLGLPGSSAIYSDTIVIGLFAPLSIPCGFLLADMGARLQSRWPRSRYLLLGLFLVALLLGGRSRMMAPPQAAILVEEADMAAMEWIKENTPEEAKFLVASYFWDRNPDLAVGSDAGYWIPLLTGRATTLPTMLYVFDGTPEYRSQVNELVAAVSTSLDSEETRGLLSQEGVTHLYIGKNLYGFPLEKFVDNPHYRMVYSYNGVWIFEVIGSGEKDELQSQ